MPIQPVDKIWMDGKLVDWDNAQVHVLTHTLHYGLGAFEGIPATQRNVDVPYSVAYDMKGSQITALRLYFPLELLIRAVGADHAPP